MHRQFPLDLLEKFGRVRHMYPQAGQPVTGCAHGITYVDWNTHRMTPTGSG